jgi:hypothetical protein
MFGHSAAQSIWTAKQQHRESLINAAEVMLAKYDESLDEDIVNTK